MKLLLITILAIALVISIRMGDEILATVFGSLIAIIFGLGFLKEVFR